MQEVQQIFSIIYSINSCEYINAENPNCTHELRPRNDCYWTNVGKGCFHKQQDMKKLNQLAKNYSLQSNGETKLEDAIKYFAKEFYGVEASAEQIKFYVDLFWKLRE